MVVAPYAADLHCLLSIIMTSVTVKVTASDPWFSNIAGHLSYIECLLKLKIPGVHCYI